MTNYNNLTQEQKESITKELRDLFELRENLKKRHKMWTNSYKDLNLGIDYFQEGEKLAIKIIDEEIEFLGGKINVEKMTIDTTSLQINIVSNSYDEYAHKCFDYEPIIKMIKIRIEELKKQREQLQFEVELK